MSLFKSEAEVLFVRDRENKLKELLKRRESAEAMIKEVEEYKNSNVKLHSIMASIVEENANLQMKDIDNELKLLDDNYYNFYIKKALDEVRSAQHVKYLMKKYNETEEDAKEIIRVHSRNAFLNLESSISQSIYYYKKQTS
jgi:hypothetical protein